MLAIVRSDSPHLKHHLETLVVFNPTQPASVLDEAASEENRSTTSA